MTIESGVSTQITSSPAEARFYEALIERASARFKAMSNLMRAKTQNPNTNSSDRAETEFGKCWEEHSVQDLNLRPRRKVAFKKQLCIQDAPVRLGCKVDSWMQSCVWDATVRLGGNVAS